MQLKRTSKNQDWDTINSILCAGIYFKNQLKNYSTGRLMTTTDRKTGKEVAMKYQKRYYKPMHDSKYPTNGTPEDRFRFELCGLVRGLLVDVKKGNILREVQIYRNRNGGYQEDGDNKLLVTLLFENRNFKLKEDHVWDIPNSYVEVFEETFEILRKML